MKKRPDNTLRMLHIRDAIREIENYTAESTENSFSANSMQKFAVVKQLEIIGEAANNITDDLKLNNPDIEWEKIIGLRHILVHEYYGIDEYVVWNIVQNDIPELKKKTQKILEGLEK